MQSLHLAKVIQKYETVVCSDVFSFGAWVLVFQWGKEVKGHAFPFLMGTTCIWVPCVGTCGGGGHMKIIPPA